MINKECFTTEWIAQDTPKIDENNFEVSNLG